MKESNAMNKPRQTWKMPKKPSNKEHNQNLDAKESQAFLDIDEAFWFQVPLLFGLMCQIKFSQILILRPFFVTKPASQSQMVAKYFFNGN